MYSKTTKIVNASGLHARPASLFVKEVKNFTSEIMIQKEDSEKKIPAKSLIAIMAGGFSEGTTLTISASGDDEVVAVDTLVAMIESGFGE